MKEYFQYTFPFRSRVDLKTNQPKTESQLVPKRPQYPTHVRRKKP